MKQTLYMCCFFLATLQPARSTASIYLYMNVPRDIAPTKTRAGKLFEEAVLGPNGAFNQTIAKQHINNHTLDMRHDPMSTCLLVACLLEGYADVTNTMLEKGWTIYEHITYNRFWPHRPRFGPSLIEAIIDEEHDTVADVDRATAVVLKHDTNNVRYTKSFLTYYARNKRPICPLIGSFNTILSKAKRNLLQRHYRTKTTFDIHNCISQKETHPVPWRRMHGGHALLTLISPEATHHERIKALEELLSWIPLCTLQAVPSYHTLRRRLPTSRSPELSKHLTTGIDYLLRTQQHEIVYKIAHAARTLMAQAKPNRLDEAQAFANTFSTWDTRKRFCGFTAHDIQHIAYDFAEGKDITRALTEFDYALNETTIEQTLYKNPYFPLENKRSFFTKYRNELVHAYEADRHVKNCIHWLQKHSTAYRAAVLRTETATRWMQRAIALRMLNYVNHYDAFVNDGRAESTTKLLHEHACAHHELANDEKSELRKRTRLPKPIIRHIEPVQRVSG